MKNLTSIGRIFFALALMGLGATHFVFGDFITGRAPAWPETVPGRLVWAYFTGLFFIGTGAAIIIKKKARHATIFAGILILIWALLRHVPVLSTVSIFAGEWTNAGKALVLAGGSFTLAGTLHKTNRNSSNSSHEFWNLQSPFVVFGQVCLGLFLLITGVQHFIFTDFVASLIPVWFPGEAVFWTYFGGVALIAGGTGLLIPKTACLAALLSGIMIFSWFWIIHIPRTFTSVSDGIAVFEALAVSGIAFVIAGYLYRERTKPKIKEDPNRNYVTDYTQ